MSREGVGLKHTAEQAVEALLSFGAVPRVVFNSIIPTIDEVIDKPPSPKGRKFIIGLASLLMILSACNVLPPEHQEPAEFRYQNLPPAGAAAAAEEAQPWATDIAAQEGTTVERSALSEYQPREFNETWRQYATVQEGEGVIDALRRQSGAEPHAHTNVPAGYQQVIELLHVGDPNNPSDDWLEVYSWPALLNLNPTVQPGDMVLDTFNEIFRQNYPLLPENSHLD
jgi:hypothetical protein